MILEGIVTSLDQNDELNIAPMGPIVDEGLKALVLRPFRTSRTFQNLQARPYGVFHVVDDVLLLAQAAIGQLPPTYEHFAAERVTGRVLSAACRWYEFEIESCDDSQERTELRARIVHSGRLRDFLGFNRAKHAVLEGAILATRLHLLPPEKIRAEFDRLRVIVDKTAGPQERAAFALLERYIAAPREVTVSTGARLHFGFFAHGHAGHRQFGGVGVMVDQPGFVVRARPAAVDELRCGLWQDRVAALVGRLRACAAADMGRVPGPLCLEIAAAPAAHAGLGSGTQLGMAVAKVCSILSGEGTIPAHELARRAGRGMRSAVGLYGFEHGGLLVEGGKRNPAEISPLVSRVDFPEEWRFVLARPRGATAISGIEEAREFARLDPMPAAMTDRLCRLALTEILPAAVERDFASASEAIGQFGRHVGESFAHVQGGLFADEQMRRLADRLSSQGIRGIGQTSWGPTLFVLCPNAAAAQDLSARLATEPAAANCEFTIAAPLNRGATIALP